MCDDVFDEDAGPRQELNLIAKEFEKINMNIEKVSRELMHFTGADRI